MNCLSIILFKRESEINRRLQLSFGIYVMPDVLHVSAYKSIIRYLYYVYTYG
jgi:hypothetical protein